MLQQLKALWQDEDGATMVEYALMVALIALVAIGVITTLGSNLKAVFTSASTQIVTP